MQALRGLFCYYVNMSLPTIKFAVYYGTITLHTGAEVTYTAEEVAELYGVEAEDYLEVPLAGPEPFLNGQDYMQYVHLKPLPDQQYYNAIARHNTEFEDYFDEDFDARRNGKWAERPQFVSDEDAM